MDIQACVAKRFVVLNRAVDHPEKRGIHFPVGSKGRIEYKLSGNFVMVSLIPVKGIEERYPVNVTLEPGDLSLDQSEVS